MKSKILMTLMLLAAVSHGEQVMQESVLLNGRWEKTSEFIRTSAPAASVTFQATASELRIDLEGSAKWRLDMDGKEILRFQTNERTTKLFPVSGGQGKHLFRLIKVSESNPGEAKIYSISTDEKGKVHEAPKSTGRRIEFIGDSFTVGFGNLGQNGNDAATDYETTDASKSYAYLLAEGFKAEYQVNAVSGRGLVRNYANIVPEWTLAKLYNYTVPGMVEKDAAPAPWNFDQFHPQVIVIFMGINDFQGEPPYADKKAFRTAYSAFLDDLRKKHLGVKFLLVSTKVWPNDDLTGEVKAVYDAEIAKGNKDLEFLTVKTDNSAYLGHPTLRSHVDLANTMRPIIGRLGKWQSR